MTEKTDMKQQLDKLGKLPGGVSTALIAATAVVGAALGALSVVDIEPGEVAVRVNNITGSQTAITTPGWTVRLPFVHAVYVMDAKPQTFTMKGEDDRDALNVRELTVRASDGSNFRFQDTTIIFRLTGDQVVTAAQNAGTDDGFLRWIKPYARSILRDEFGRESTINVSNPTTYGAAAQRAKDRLNEVLGPHGIQVAQLVTPRPRFNEAYEKAIEDRNSLSNELEVIKSNLDRAATDRDRQLAEVDQEKNRLIQERRATLESELAEAVARQAEVRRESDSFRIEKVAEGQAFLSAAERRAVELRGELAAKYEAKRAEISAFRNQPVERVMEKLGEKLDGVTISIQPWADDATPSRVRYEEARNR